MHNKNDVHLESNVIRALKLNRVNGTAKEERKRMCVNRQSEIILFPSIVLWANVCNGFPFVFVLVFPSLC